MNALPTICQNIQDSFNVSAEVTRAILEASERIPQIAPSRRRHVTQPGSDQASLLRRPRKVLSLRPSKRLSAILSGGCQQKKLAVTVTLEVAKKMLVFQGFPGVG